MAMRRILGCIKKADEDYKLIQDGDRIAVGISFGKDSMTLIEALRLYKFFSKKDYEIIAINDGSTDDSAIMCNQLCKKYDNIIYVYQPNDGASTARNTGLMMAEGDLIAFVDADDVVRETYFMDLYHHMGDNIALVVSNPYKVKQNGAITKPIKRIDIENLDHYYFLFVMMNYNHLHQNLF